MSAAATAPRTLTFATGTADFTDPNHPHDRRGAAKRFAHLRAFSSWLNEWSHPTADKTQRGDYWCPFEKRAKHERPAWSALVLDFDHGAPSPELERYERVVHETRTAGHWRVIVGLTEPIPQDEARGIARALGADTAAAVGTQLFWGRHPERKATYHAGELLDWRALAEIAALLGDVVAPHESVARMTEREPQRFDTMSMREIVQELNTGTGPESYDSWRDETCALRTRVESLGSDSSVGYDAWHAWSARSAGHTDCNMCKSIWGGWDRERAAISPEPTPADFPDLPSPSLGSAESATAEPTTSAASIKPQKTEWLWHLFLARGTLHLLAGAPKAGKSMASMDLAAIVSRGGCWPDGSQAPLGNVVLFTAEESPSRTLVPRLIAAGADRSRVHILTDRKRLEEAIARHSPELVILDPITSGLIEPNDSAKVRQQLEPLAQLAERTGTAILGITHFKKGGADLTSLEKVLGSTSFVAVARIILAMGSGDQGSVFGVVGSNYKYPAPRGYRIEDATADDGIETARIVWTDVLQGSAEEALSKTEPNARRADNDALVFLQEALENGPRLSRELDDEAREAGVTKASINRARRKYKALFKSWKAPETGLWMWSLAPSNFETLTATLETT